MDEFGLEVPRRLGDPPKLFFWDLDVAVIFSFSFIVGASMDMLITSLVIGAALAYSYSKFKSGKHPAYAIHLAYWYLPEFAFGAKRVPPSHIRELLG